MGKTHRVDIRGILADPDLRRELMVPTLQATQAREGIETTREEAERAYYVVTEAERAAFFELERFRAAKAQPERRDEMFVRVLREEAANLRHDIARSDFSFIDGSLLAYRNIGWLVPLFREFPPLAPTYGVTRSGLNTTEIDRFTRQRWEVECPQARRRWVLFAKGGQYSRFYTDWDLVIDWTDEGREFKTVVKSKYGSASRFVKSEEEYFRIGITWMQTTNLGINARVLPGEGLFGVASPSFFPKEESSQAVMLAIMNSVLFDAIARCVATRNWGATAIGSIPVPQPSTPTSATLADYANDIYESKAKWDEGNEPSARFRVPWLVHDGLIENVKASLPQRLQRLADVETKQEARIRKLYDDLNSEVYGLYGIPKTGRATVEEALGERPPEVLWPQMEGRTAEQKRMEHVFRLLSYAVRRVVEADEDGIFPFASVAGEPSLLERVIAELQVLFPEREAGQVEIEIANELRRGAKGHRRTSSIAEWLENVFFDYHCGLYRNRPIIWHIASAQGTKRFAFGALIHYHRFDKNRMGKLRGQYLRDAIESFRREAALADRAGRSEERLEWQGRLEEAQDLDRRLQWVQEGHYDGPEGGERDFRIMTPWKSPGQRPKGWDPDLDDGVKVNIEPMQKADVLRIAKVV